MGMLIVASLVILVLWFFLIQNYARRKYAPGESVYLDRGINTKVLVSLLYGIRAKPDNIEVGSDDTLVLVELKDRARPIVYPSDKAQIIATVIAARESGYNVTRAMLEVRGGKRIEVSLRDNNEKLIAMIKDPLEAARIVARGDSPKALPTKAKCSTCGFRSQCYFKA